MSSMEGYSKKEKSEESSNTIEDEKGSTLEKILKGSVLLYKDSQKGGDCLVMDTPSEKNKNKFVFKHEDGSVFKLTKEQLQKLLDNGTVSLISNQEHLENLLANAREHLEKEAKKGSGEHLEDLLAEARDYLEKEAKKGSGEHLEDLLKEIRALRKKEDGKEVEDLEKNTDKEDNKEVTHIQKEDDKENESPETQESVEQNEKETDPISEEEYKEFVDTGKVSEEIIREIARRIIEHEKLSDSQLAIYAAPKNKVEKSIAERIEEMIKEMSSENTEGDSSSDDKEKKIYKKGSQEHLNALLLEIEEIKEKQQKLKEDLERNNNINNLLDTEDSFGFQEKMTEIIKLENQLKEKNREKNILEHDLKYGTELQRAKERTWVKPGEEQEAKTTEGAVEDFLQEYRLDEIPEEFNDLSPEQKFFVIRSLKNRIIDVVKSDAQTQYSEELKEKLQEEVQPNEKWKQALSKVKKIGKSAWAKVTKEFDMSRIEGEVFKKIRDTEEGKKLIAENMLLLSKHMSELKVEYDEEDKDHFYTAYIDSGNIENCTEEEKNAIKNFNLMANEFAEIPYEWGQLNKKSSKKKEYEKAKAEYEKAKQDIYLIKEQREGSEEKGYSMLEVMHLDSAIQMEQLLNTHPEFEKELNKFRVEADGRGGFKALSKTGVNALDTITGGKGEYNNFANKVLFVSGALIRSGTKLGTAALTGAKVASGTLSSKAAYGISTGVGLVAAPVFGATFGAIKGRHRAKETLQTNKEKARYGEKDTSAQRTATVDMTKLSDKLNKLVTEIENTENQEEKSKKLALLSVRIEHSMGKIEKGQVNFGDKKSLLVNQMNFNEALNKAIVLNESSKKEIDEEIEKKIENTLEYIGEDIKHRTSENQKIFIKKQMKKAALIGAGAATAGYLLRWFGEEAGWWGHPHEAFSSTHASKEVEVKIPDTTNQTEEIILPKDTVTSNTTIINPAPEDIEDNGMHILPPPDANKFTEQADKWVEKATNHINHSEIEPTEKIVPIHKPATYEGYHQPLNGPVRPANSEMYPSNNDQQKIPNPPSGENINKSDNLLRRDRPGEYRGYNQPYGVRRRVTFRDLFRRKHHDKDILPQDNSNQPIENNEPTKNAENIYSAPRNTDTTNPSGQNYEQPDTNQKYTEPDIDSSINSSKNIEIQHENLMQKKLEEEALAPIDTKHIPRPVYNNPNNVSNEHLEDLAKHKIHNIGRHSHNTTAHIKKLHPRNTQIENTIHNINTTKEDVYETSRTPYGPQDYTGDKSISAENTTNADDYIQKVHNTGLENKNNNAGFDRSDLKTTNPGEDNDFSNISSKSNISMENNSTLNPELLENTNKIYKDNIKHIFSRNINNWEKIKNNPAESMWNIKEDSREYTLLNRNETKFIDYLHKLRDVTKLKPNSGTLTMSAETNEEYIKRALEKAEEEGTINKIKLG